MGVYNRQSSIILGMFPIRICSIHAHITGNILHIIIDGTYIKVNTIIMHYIIISTEDGTCTYITVCIWCAACQF